MAKKSRKPTNRTIPVQVYLDENELLLLDACVKESGARNRSEYLRRSIHSVIYEVDYSELHQANESLWRAQNSLNQIARRVNSTGSFYESDLNDVKELMNEIWHTQEFMLSQLRLEKPSPTSATNPKQTRES